MNYTDQQKLLSGKFRTIEDKIIIPELEIGIYKCTFRASPLEKDIPEIGQLNGHELFLGYNSLAYRNLNFDYYVLQPHTSEAKKSAIIMLHGLNERSWDKYLAWACTLAKQTSKSVILFPIAFHMNRAPEAWYDSRQMSRFVDARKKHSINNEDLSFANIAISERLTYAPDQFFLSGYQSAKDIFDLSKAIKKGEQKYFNKNASIDFFGYSYGAFLEEILLLANPENLYTNSRFFFFCGGCVFSEFYNSSKFIIDNRALMRIKDFYTKELDIEKKRSTLLAKLLTDTEFGKAFCQLCTLDNFNNTTNDQSNRLDKNVKIVGLKKDKIVNESALYNTFGEKKIEYYDFDYPYSHEMPFPLSDNGISKNVNEAFNKVFKEATKFLN